MIHWAFLIPAFVLGFASCYFIISLLAKALESIPGDIKGIINHLTPFG